MKRLKLLLLTAFLAVALVACNGDTDEADLSDGNDAEQAEDTEYNEDEPIPVGTWKTAQTIQPFYYNETAGEDVVEVKPFTNPGDMKTALLSGDLDFTGTTWVTALMSAAKGEPVKVVATMTEKCSALVVGADSDIEEVADLKGKTVAYVPGTMHHILLLESLTNAGLDPDTDVKLVNIDFFDMGQALASGSIDAFLSGEPYPSMAEIEGYGRILEYPYYDDSIGYINAAMITTEDIIEERPEEIQKLVDLHILSTKELMEDKETWLELSKEFGTDEKYLRKGMEENMDLAWDITDETVKKVENLAVRMKELGMIDEVPSMDELFDRSFLDNSTVK